MKWISVVLVVPSLMMAVSPVFASGKVFNVRQYGAVGNGTNLDTVALQKAIDAAAVAGGTVVFPPGRYLSGSLDLKSHVTLQLNQDAVLLGSPHRADYQRKLFFYGLILADKQQDIAICGKGVIDGQGKALSDEVERLFREGKLPKQNESERPVIINFRNCTKVTVRDITLKDSACWVQHYLDCDRLMVENLTVRSNAAFNNDGIDVDGCTHAVVRNCDIDSEDDAICLKAMNRDCDDLLVENCRFRSSCNGLKFGTASRGGFKNIICRNLDIYDTYLSGIALEIVDGGTMENVLVSDITITNTSNAIFVRLGHRNVKGKVGMLRDVTIRNVTAQIPDRDRALMNKFPDEQHKYRGHTMIVSSLTGLPGHPVQNVTLENIRLAYGGIGNSRKPAHQYWDNLSKVPECSANYPESHMFGILPAWGFYCRHAEGIKFKNVTLRVEGKDYRPALVCDDVNGLELDGFHVKSAGTEPVIVLHDVAGAKIRDSVAPAGASAFIKATGSTPSPEVSR